MTQTDQSGSVVRFKGGWVDGGEEWKLCAPLNHVR